MVQLQLQLQLPLGATQEEGRSFPKTWEPNCWAGRVRGAGGAHLMGNPFVGQTSGMAREAEQEQEQQEQQTRRRSPTPGQPPHTGSCIRRSGQPLTLNVNVMHSQLICDDLNKLPSSRQSRTVN